MTRPSGLLEGDKVLVAVVCAVVDGLRVDLGNDLLRLDLRMRHANPPRRESNGLCSYTSC